MHYCSISERFARVRLQILAGCVIALFACGGVAQNTPLISGGIGFFSDTTGGVNTLQPVIAPLIAAPLGKHLLAESRSDFREFINNGSGSYTREYFGSLSYLQLDYIANSKLTFVGGHFITPFGTYNERLSPIWVPNFQNSPLIYGIGTRSSGASNGGEVRGVAFSNAKVQVNYIGYLSGGSQIRQLQAARTVGDQVAVFFPTKGLEIGTSYQRYLQQVHINSVGVHVWWLPPNSAFALRSEYAHGATSQGYWVETAYRFSRFGGMDSWKGRFEPAFRIQQTSRRAPNLPGESDALPKADTQQVDFGFNYHFPDELRLNTSYGRQFTTKNQNIWDISLTYRFLFPAWRGRK